MNPFRKAIVGSVALLTVAGGAAGLALTGTASAASDSGSSDTTVVTSDSGTSTPTGDTQLAPPTGEQGGPRGDQPAGPHQANGITEEELTGDTATSVEAAVTAAYPDATIERMETDAEGAAYEAHITQADGSDLTVKLDASFAITETVQGHG
jgi:hypothetical protein